MKVIMYGLLTHTLHVQGPKSPEVVALARQIGAYAVRGNHDDSSLLSYYKWADHQPGKGTKTMPGTGSEVHKHSISMRHGYLHHPFKLSTN
jgi:DNA repair exonuclease SbcCD nuclease subunit